MSFIGGQLQIANAAAAPACSATNVKFAERAAINALQVTSRAVDAHGTSSDRAAYMRFAETALNTRCHDSMSLQGEV